MRRGKVKWGINGERNEGAAVERILNSREFYNIEKNIINPRSGKNEKTANINNSGRKSIIFYEMEGILEDWWNILNVTNFYSFLYTVFQNGDYENISIKKNIKPLKVLLHYKLLWTISKMLKRHRSGNLSRQTTRKVLII